MKTKKAYKVLKQQPPINMPYDVMRFFPEDARRIEFAGDQASFGEDYGDLKELREVIDWLADQFGGKVKWDEKK